ncbi:hypothetical protein KI688_006940 [Linnemannia hyalina]|uniref:DUS-like FMN-binding domain-containing protein n=1 Tax=Linnemannia hyalina TaxID=64524 RepID=A0A9P7XJN7_9FUNG|nr:hypothetical protein KI688_006940 [Linnemannia hyalina]
MQPQPLNYTNAAILAPMVRIGTLPVRLMALEYGADLVYTPEVVDRGIVGCERVVNEDNGTIDYLSKGVSIFRTHPSEKSKLVFQIGSANADLALQAALTVAQDVSTIDLNCGCPKRFSIHGGMGAALMEEPEKLCGILKNLVDNCGLPVTCKIRIFPDRERTLKLVKMIEATGIRALAVHCRYRDERPREPGHWDRFKEIVDAVSIPVIANGDIKEYADMARIRELSGCAGVMIARGAEANVSIFRKEGRLPHMDIVRQYIRRMFVEDTKSPYYRPLCDAKSFRAVCKVFEMEDEFDSWTKKQEEHGWPTDLDNPPRKAAEAKEKEAKAANVKAKTKNDKVADVKMAEVVAESTLGKRKQDDLKEEEEEKVVVATASVSVSAGEVDGTPAAKKHAAGDGASSQPTPADTPQPDVETEVETISTTSTPLA